MTTTEKTFEDFVNELGITIKVGRATIETDEKGWEHIKTTVKLSQADRLFHVGSWSAGLGYLKPAQKAFEKLTVTKKSRQIANLKLGKWSKPSPADVMHSLLMDGQAYFDHITFEEFCSEYGYDTDSRKAESIYKACLDEGRTIARQFDSETIDTLRDLANEY